MSIQVPPDSSGKVVETKTVSGQERQVVVLGDPANPAGLGPVDAVFGQAVDLKRVGAGAELDGHSATLGATADAEAAAGDGTLVAIAKRLRTLLGGGLPAALVGGRLPVDGSGVTQPVSAAALPLPAGAATQASLAAVAVGVGAPADGEAGAGDGSAIAVLKRLRTLLADGLPALVGGRLPVDPSGVTSPVSGTVAVSGVAGNVATTAAAASQADGHSATLGAQADAAAGSDAGAASLVALVKRGLQRLATLIGQLPAALVSGRLDVNLGAAPATVTAALAAGTNVIGYAGLNPRTSGGLSVYRSGPSAAGTMGASVKASAGQLYAYIVSNVASGPRWLRFYDLATAPTVGTSSIKVGPILLPAGFTGHIEFAQGIEFPTGIAVACTAGMADNDAANVGANEVCLQVLFK